jgi:hypothetical protein
MVWLLLLLLLFVASRITNNFVFWRSQFVCRQATHKTTPSLSFHGMPQTHVQHAPV